MVSSSATTSIMAMQPICDKLNKQNHATWKAQVLAAVRGLRLEGYLTGKIAAPTTEADEKDNNGKPIKVPNPAYEAWVAQDQQVLSFILSSLSKETLTPIATKATAAAAWREIEGLFSSQTRAHVVNTRLALATMQKGSSTMTEYFNKMRSLGEEMAAAGRRLDDDELVEYILTGLDFEYNPIVSSVLARSESLTLSELYAQLLAFETRLELMGQGSNASLVNMAGRGRVGFGRGFGRGGNRGRGQPAGRGRGGNHGAGAGQRGGGQ
jgi:hypothetical protein